MDIEIVEEYKELKERSQPLHRPREDWLFLCQLRQVSIKAHGDVAENEASRVVNNNSVGLQRKQSLGKEFL